MALRLIEIYHQKGKAEEIEFLLKESPLLNMWHGELAEDETITKVLLKVEDTEPVLDILQKYFLEHKTFRLVILPVEATLPRPEEEEQKEEEVQKKSPERISTEELYQKLMHVSGASRKFVVMAVLASFVAAIGLLKNDTAVIIGSMVIAPLLSPNMALSLATTLADAKLAKKAILTNIIGFLIVLVISITMGFSMHVDPTVPEITSRSDVSHYYIFLALATGVAGAYSIATGVAEALVGVMVAVALLPPLVAAGLLFGAQYWLYAIGAFLLFFVNVVSINLSGVVTFVLQGIQPKNWWEAERAKKAVRIAVALWIVLLVLLAVMIFFEQQLKQTIK